MGDLEVERTEGGILPNKQPTPRTGCEIHRRRDDDAVADRLDRHGGGVERVDTYQHPRRR